MPMPPPPILGQRFAPGLMDFVLSRSRAMFGQQLTELPDPGEDNLERPSTGPGQVRNRRLESSDKVRTVKERSLSTEMVWQRPFVKRALVAVTAAGVGWAVTR